ncbi:MAG TPA: hypothetical protein VFX37_01410, partial [Pseudolabrys sp.]|nr:hypothetical protein [Pseudolabrys sp.]
LIDAIVRNVEGNPTGAPLAAEPLASYMKGAIRVLSEQRYDDLALGLMRFPDPDKMNEHVPIRA